MRISQLIQEQAKDGVLHESGAAHLKAMSLWEDTVRLGLVRDEGGTVSLGQIGHRAKLTHLDSTALCASLLEDAVNRMRVDDFTRAIQRSTETPKEILDLFLEVVNEAGSVATIFKKLHEMRFVESYWKDDVLNKKISSSDRSDRNLQALEYSSALLSNFLSIALQAPAKNINSFSDLAIDELLAPRNIPFSTDDTERRSQLVVAGGSCFNVYFGLMEILSKRGSKVLSPQGTFDGLNAVPAPYNLETVVLNTQDTRYQLTASKVSEYLAHEDANETVALFITNPLNPLGTYYDVDEAMKIVALCYENNILPIVDEHFLGLSHNLDSDDSSLLSHSFRASDGTTIRAFDVCVGVCGTTKYLGIEEYRAGFAYSGDNNLMQQLRTTVTENDRDLNRGEEILLTKAIGSLEDHNKEDRIELGKKLQLVESLVRDTNGTCGSDVIRIVDTPEGGVFACLSFDGSLCESVGVTSDYELFIYLFEAAGVEVRSLHGNTFNNESNRFARINISMPSEENLREAFGRIQTLCSQLISGNAEPSDTVSNRFFDKVRQSKAFRSVSRSKNSAIRKAQRKRKQKTKDKKRKTQQPVNSEVAALKVLRSTIRNKRSFINIFAALSSSGNFRKQRGKKRSFNTPDIAVAQAKLVGDLTKQINAQFADYLRKRKLET